MLSGNEYQTNVSTQLQYRGLLEKVMFSTLTTVPCCVFLFINGTMLFTLRSRRVFRETSRYILLYNLLFADTVQLAQAQLLYLLAVSRILLMYSACVVLTLLTDLTNDISPLTLVVMSLERYVAVCYPLRHTTVVTVRNGMLQLSPLETVAVTVVWAFSSLNMLIRVLLLLDFISANLQMNDICGRESMLLSPVSDLYDKVYYYVLFVSASAVITSSYIGVMVAARAASTDKASARKARNTLLLHLVQLSLCLLSTMHSQILIVLSKIVTRLVFVYIQIVFYVCIFISPRCLSALIYGIRDQTIRPVLVNYLCYRKLCPSSQG
uniref:LOW QUALITY PROTEIN: olfactory receptor 1-like n=1 Tax=Monopterus albus TaxID=43700 RepID=UPI0009B3750E|nr:LOW QUALITY PROTEIN: olfactory receptor 1-like [Monopterus albus]